MFHFWLQSQPQHLVSPTCVLVELGQRCGAKGWSDPQTSLRSSLPKHCVSKELHGEQLHLVLQKYVLERDQCSRDNWIQKCRSLSKNRVSPLLKPECHLITSSLPRDESENHYTISYLHGEGGLFLLFPLLLRSKNGFCQVSCLDTSLIRGAAGF